MHQQERGFIFFKSWSDYTEKKKKLSIFDGVRQKKQQRNPSRVLGEGLINKKETVLAAELETYCKNSGFKSRVNSEVLIIKSNYFVGNFLCAAV